MQNKLLRLVLLLSLFSFVSACKLRIEVPDGGYVSSASGNYDCVQGVNAGFAEGGFKSLPGPGHVSAAHDENIHCEFDVSTTAFDETFTAIAYEGYEFTHWRKVDRGLFGNNKKNPLRLLTAGFDTFEILVSVLKSDTIYYLEPVFQRLNRDGNDKNCEVYEGSFDRIQSIVFEGYGCTNSACHGGETAAGNLDLSPDVAYRNLYRELAAANLLEPMQRLFPGEQKNSFLFLKLAAASTGAALPTGGGLPMPLVNTPLSADHLEAMRLWIRNGAPEYADVDDVASLLGCSQRTPPTANKIEAPDPPAIGEGVQFISGPWTVESNSENEVCFATYYDLDKMPGYLPDWAKTECEGGVFSAYDGSCMAVNSRILTQDPQSHHSIISAYVGATSPLDASWGQWQCLNGPNQGMSCDPTRIGEPVADGGADCGGNQYVCGTEIRKAVGCRGWGPADRNFRQVSMGGSQSPIAAEKFAADVYSILPTRALIIWNSHAFNLTAKATTIEQYNNFDFAPQDQRGYRNRAIFELKNIFVANVPPFSQRTYCSIYTLPQGARLTELSSHAHKRSVFWQTWLPPQDPNCTVASGCQPNNTTADYVSRIYNDPLRLLYDPPLEFDSANVSERTVKSCLTYDNGLEFPELLKRNSTSVGSQCLGQAFCVGGASQGMACGSDDSVCGDQGACDACTVRGGVTTEDEMFIPLGSFYVVPESERN